MSKRTILIVVIILCFIIVSFYITNSKGKYSNKYQKTQYWTKEQKIKDFNYMYNILKENYPYFAINERVNGIDWLSKKNEYVKKINKGVSDAEFYITLLQIINDLNNVHTKILDPLQYKFILDYFTKEKYQVEHFNFEDSIEQYNKWEEIFYMSSLVVDNKDYETNSGLETSIIKENIIAYMKVNVFWLDCIEKDKLEIYKFYKEIENYPDLIIDIRGNGGGSSSYWKKNIVEPLINSEIILTYQNAYRSGEYIKAMLDKKIYNDKIINVKDIKHNKDYPPELFTDFDSVVETEEIFNPINKFNFKGKIYLLVDDKVFSSADAFADFAKTSKWATVVGTKTGGDGLGYDCTYLRLPNTGLIIQFSWSMGLNSNGQANEEVQTTPDIVTKSSEEALRKVLDIINSKY